ncbi:MULTISPECIES: exodeoxyribonuclease VII small subunit [unclassified Thermoactinomyces]|jgi:exodeoxyribonuclease VII small subunit|uniref:exodeoxyribonuclease VII small subunit n=1 Tax=unclassified Thermoactinomyces TaxID=2634588 RepID=UPI0018DB4945|nr:MULTISPECIES: exodeoxyribonuclease VII small subunit [unclassified Thermoactinomyces]MBH8596742.1 exodeoxyribonuclease VII small subunit [Thermoactinomyces sp. CICC 10523]MBH8603504.1 exodeoxyribonuclease VII small subunit [Thermoactinomyces sp. CICC 10522]MBH8606668.1 exodeoxyribonuclease VII small subunit [Thermoactinomyces sp. CICC 10521]
MSEPQKNSSLESLPFEEALKRLEEVVEILEKGDTPLEQAIQLFDEGMKLAHICGKKLEWAEQQVEMLVQENGEWVKKSFKVEEDSE